MEKESKFSSLGLILVYGYAQTVIESQVFAHARVISEAGIQTDVWVFSLNKKEYLAAEVALPQLQIDHNINIKLFHGVMLEPPFSVYINGLILLWHMWRHDARPLFVHGRTENAAVIAAVARKFRRFTLIWDARGDALSEYIDKMKMFSGKWNVLRVIRRWFSPVEQYCIERRLKMAALQCDGAIFVSEALRRLQGSILPESRTLIVPCLADERLFYYCPELREKMRSQLGYAKEDKIMIYVGSTARWHSIEETVQLFEQSLRAYDNFRGLVITSNSQVFKSMFSSDISSRIDILSVRLTEVNPYLNAADYGILLRKPGIFSQVASPVKFAEYSLAGLTVIVNNTVDQIIKIGGEIGNIAEVRDFVKNPILFKAKLDSRSRIAVLSRSMLGRLAYKAKIISFYTRLFSETQH